MKEKSARAYTASPSSRISNLWDGAAAAKLSPPQLLLYRSNLLGSDPRITNFGGGNTSAKLPESDPLSGSEVPVLWVKGSGGDLGTMKLDGFSTLYLDKLLALEARHHGAADEDRIVSLYAHCAFNLNPRAASIDTPLHALIDRAHVDHVHPDAVIAIAACADGRALTRKIYGDDIGWLPWMRPGFELALELKRFVASNPQARGVVLESHGLFTWGATSEECYRTTIDAINRAIDHLETRAGRDRAFGDGRVAALPTQRRRAIAAAVMPRLRGLICAGGPKVGHFDDSPEVLEFVDSAALERLAALGTSCPDHFLRTKIRPLVLPFDPQRDTEERLIERIPAAVQEYRTAYAQYYERCKRSFSPSMRDPNAVVYLIPAVGMITFAANKSTARIAAQFYVNAINVMRGASSVSSYRALPEQEAFDIEYWPLEEAKLRRLPSPKPLAGRVALVTGGAGGIGTATARRLLEEGASVVLTDIDRDALAQTVAALQERHGADGTVGIAGDVTSEPSIEALFSETCAQFGGLDICVSNAGIASAAAIEDTTLDLWRRNMDILSTGYFLVSRQCVRLLRAQGLGGSVVFIGSKNALAASAGASAYCAAKASELHLARCLALECAPLGIRVNVVNPDAVLRGSRIWQGEWAEQRARANNTTAAELEAVYRNRSLLKRSVYPEDVAEAVLFLASDRSSKSTGNILNVDAGNAAAFTR
ncbi:MAG TPA: bifunctional rhamnulose-1-phosphate aldolase/short-chain dehydrogenase [Steroidobacteraceae bacterium]|nr:bifunctional rhamnulose-1-phosphate aldolase/short-chain dehydrogenase [Steroidobacteraceae bacterium]